MRLTSLLIKNTKHVENKEQCTKTGADNNEFEQ